MDQPRTAAKKPALLDLEPGKYFWCRCGHSSKQPFCDGSHKGTGISPLAFELTEKKKVALCQCKHSGNHQYCDGTHAKLK